MSKKILITGADGFIGSHLTEALVRLGYSVRAFSLYNSFGACGWLDRCSLDVRDSFEIISGDIRDPNGVKVAMTSCDAVMHLAALIAIPYSYTSPHSYVETNIIGTLNVLQAAKDLELSNIIHTSTSEVYGTARYVPIDEAHPLLGQSPYSATKIGADQLAYSFYSSFGSPVSIVRPFNTYGPRQSARAVIPTIIGQIAAGKTDISLGAVHTTRDFNYVEDTVSGFIAALQNISSIGEVINLGSNFEISISDTVDIIARLMGRPVNILQDVTRVRPELSEVERLWANNTKAKDLLQWVPKFSGKSGFEKGLSSTIEWFVRPENQALYKSNIYNI